MHKHENLLRIKLAANKQRLLRNQYLAELPEQLGAYLERCPYIQSPELDDLIPTFHISPNGIVRDATDTQDIIFFKPEGYVYREFSWLDQLLDATISVGDRHDQEMAFLYPFAGPLYIVPFGWVRKNISQLFTCEWCVQDFGTRRKYCLESVGVITTNRDAGLILDSYCGYLEVNPNPNKEIVYELAIWGFG